MTTVLWSGLALIAASLLQTLLDLLAPAMPGVLDPFLIVLVYAALAGGETRGMLVGAACGWVQDILFSGPIVGLSALAKLVVGFGVGLAGARFNVTGVGPRALVLVAAALLDVLLYERLAAMLGAAVPELGLSQLSLRAALTAGVGVAFYGLVARRFRQEAQA
jgi:rod shape-determining protein MreD